jgi:membrane protein required for colicin V production
MVIIVILVYCVVRGIFRGLAKEISSIIGVLAGFYAAYTYYMEVAKPLARWISDPAYLNIVSFMIIFGLVFLMISILGIIIKYLLNITFLGWVDRISGAIFGLVKAILVVSIFLIILTAFLPKGAPLIKTSVLSPHVSLISEQMAKVVSKDMKRSFLEKIKELKKEWKIPN